MNLKHSKHQSMKRAGHLAFALIMAWLMAYANASAQDFWKPAGKPGSGHVYALSINREGHVFAGTGGSGVFRSADEGASWSVSNNGLLLNLTAINALAINEDGHLFAALTTSGYIGSGVFRSLNNGDNWTLVTTSMPDLGVFSLALNSAGHIFAGTSRGIIRSTDNGESWIVVEPSTFVGGIGINPLNGNIFAGTDSAGLIRSQDNGATWMNVGTGLGKRKVGKIAFNGRGSIFATVSASGVYRSRDDAESWTPINNGLTSTSVTTLAVDHNQNLLAGTYGQGVFRSIDEGESWSAINSGLTNLQVRSFTLDANDFAFIGTEGGGVFKSSMPTTSVQARNEEVPASFALEQNHPNPFSPLIRGAFGNRETKIVLVVPSEASQQRMLIKIYDLLGRLVAVLLDREVAPGRYEAVWNGKDMLGRELPSGTYLYQFEAGSVVMAKRMTLVR